MTATDGRTRRKLSTNEARKRLAAKKAPPAYRGPRGNQELDRAAMDMSVDRFERVLGS